MFFKGLKKTFMIFSMAFFKGSKGFHLEKSVNSKEQVAPWFLSPVKPVSWWVSGAPKKITWKRIHRNGYRTFQRVPNGFKGCQLTIP